MRLVVVGGDAAGMSAAAKAKRTDPDLEVVVFEAGPHISYSACGIPYHVAGIVPDAHDLMVLDDEKARKRGIDVHRHARVTAVDAEARTVTVQARDEPERTVAYDRLVLAHGVRPADPFGAAGLPGVHTLRSLHDGERLLATLERSRCRQAAIVGGGFIGLEVAEALAVRGVEAVLMQRGPALLTSMDPDMTDDLPERLRSMGVEVVLEAGVTGVEQREGRLVVRADEGRAVDAVVLGVGVQADPSLPRAAGVETDERGFVLVDERMRTNVEGVWAAGDCAAPRHLLTGERGALPLALPANRMGRVAGDNAAGGDSTFPGVLGTSIVRVHDFAYAQTGLTETAARAAGVDVVTRTIQAHDRAGYFPGDGPVQVKVVAEPGTGRLLGVQYRGPKEGGLRIQMAALAVQHGLTAAQVAQTETAYAPPFSPVHDPIVVCCEQLAKAL